MKKCITFMVTALCMTFMSAMTSNAADKIIYGDVNGDGAVNSSDATEILNYYAQSLTGKNEDSAKNILEIGDVNEDGSVDSADASFTLEYYSYSSTHKDAEGIRDFVGNTEESAKPATTAAAAQTPSDTVTTAIVNCVNAPEGLDPGEKGSIKYIINTAKLTPHDEIPLYNIKGDNKNGGKPYLVRNYMLTDETKIILNNFAKEHFTDEMTNYDRLAYTWEWLHFNVDYATTWEQYSKISELSFSEASFVHKSGQCIQYNGAFAEMMAYMGYDVYLLEKWNRPNFTVQHFMSEVMIDGVGYNTEVGERSYDSPPNYYWMWLFDSKRQEFFGLEDSTKSTEVE